MHCVIFDVITYVIPSCHSQQTENTFITFDDEVASCFIRFFVFGTEFSRVHGGQIACIALDSHWQECVASERSTYANHNGNRTQISIVCFSSDQFSMLIEHFTMNTAVQCAGIGRFAHANLKWTRSIIHRSADNTYFSRIDVMAQSIRTSDDFGFRSSYFQTLRRAKIVHQRLQNTDEHTTNFSFTRSFVLVSNSSGRMAYTRRQR